MINRNFSNGSMVFDPSELKVIRIFMISFALLVVYQSVILLNTRRIDSKHKELLEARNKAGLSINGLLLQSSTTQRMILNMALSTNTKEQGEFEQNIVLAENATVESFRTLESTLPHFSEEDAVLVKQLKEAAAIYQANYKNYIVYIKSGEMQEAIELKDSSVRPSLNAYQNMQQSLLTRITREVAEESEAVSSYTSVSAWVLFFIGLVPFVYAIGKLIYVSVILRFRSGGQEM